MSDKPSPKPRCGLCGKTRNLQKTNCCGNWICNDENAYVLFSYARNSCSRNHRRFTLCGYHSTESHQGRWQDCKACREAFETEMYVWYGTNEYNFEVLQNPPHYEPTHCAACGVVINLGADGYSTGARGTLCERCTWSAFSPQPAARDKKPAKARAPRPQLPANPNPDSIEIVLSAQVQKRWRIKPAVRAAETPTHWLGQWRLDFGRRSDRTQVLLATNVATLYTFVFPVAELGKSGRFEALFRLRMGFALTDAPLLARWKDAPIVFAAGNPRVAIGSMNDMRKHLLWRTETARGPMQNDEDWINQTPFLSLDDVFPNKAFHKRLAEAGTSPG